MTPHHDAPHRVPAITSHQQLQAAAAWAIVKQQCPRNYELLRAQFETKYGTHLHLRALTQFLREIKGSEPGTYNYMLWAVEAICTRGGALHQHTKPTHKPGTQVLGERNEYKP